jgi:hypothetical protein
LRAEIEVRESVGKMREDKLKAIKESKYRDYLTEARREQAALGVNSDEFPTVPVT